MVLVYRSAGFKVGCKVGQVGKAGRQAWNSSFSHGIHSQEAECWWELELGHTTETELKPQPQWPTSSSKVLQLSKKEQSASIKCWDTWVYWGEQFTFPWWYSALAPIDSGLSCDAMDSFQLSKSPWILTPFTLFRSPKYLPILKAIS